ncbi:hypothetical protein GH714_043954 [Hevea brasiliensis]|uniref:Uncharacterized protein n=1 Tax=Hevea brasiliensis TaxID=3981 RepID=A0A6A6K0B8_HEVBR|nr:hypothetical protein GH714_043954 [Hevea brasiliensis]
MLKLRVFPPDLGSRSEAFPQGTRRGLGVPVADGRARLCPRVFQPPIAVAIIAEDSAFGPTASEERTGGQDPPPHPRTGRGGWGRRLRDTQADVPSAGWLRAQLAFKDSMVRGILQFTPSIAFCCVLHRCESRDIRCRESFGPRRAGGARPSLLPRPFGATGDRRPRGPRVCGRVRGSFCGAGFDNDPSAGSPTETLLRLLLPLNDKVQWTSRDVAGGEPPTSPRSEHFTGPFIVGATGGVYKGQGRSQRELMTRAY